MSTTTTEVPKNDVAKRQQTPLQKIKGLLESDSFKDAVSKALPKHLTPDRFCRIAINATMQNPKLMECSQESLFACLMKLSQYGLEPDGRRAHLIPYENKRAGTCECTLQVDYKGIAELVMRSGLVSNIHSDVVCENDEFEYDRGTITKHKIDFRKPRGEPYAAYSVVRFKDGTEKCEVLQKDEILKIRDGSQGWMAFQKGWAKQSPWNPENPVSEREMWRKTAFRRLSKWVPWSSEIRDAVDYGDDELHSTEAANVITSTATTKSDAVAELLAKRMGQSDEAPPTDHSGEPQQQEQSGPLPTLQELMDRVGAATLKSDLDLIYDQSGHLSADDRKKLEDALNTHSDMLRSQK